MTLAAKFTKHPSPVHSLARQSGGALLWASQEYSQGMGQAER